MNLFRFAVSVLFALSIGIPLPPGVFVSAESKPNFDVISKSVLNVSADQCTGRQPQQGTGFAWNQPNTVVTALHVVAGCTSVSVRFGGSVVAWPATVNRVLRKADLVLLAISNAPPLPAMSESNQALQGDQDLWAWGFQEGAPKPSEKKFVNLN